MKRNIITIEGKSVIVTGNDVWMTAWEIGELFNVTTTAVNAAIRAILKRNHYTDSVPPEYLLYPCVPFVAFTESVRQRAEGCLYAVCADSQRRPLLRTEQTQARTYSRHSVVRSCFWSEAI